LQIRKSKKVMHQPNVIQVSDPGKDNGQHLPEVPTMAVPLASDRSDRPSSYVLTPDELPPRSASDAKIRRNRLVDVATRALDIFGSLSLAVLLLPVMFLLLVVVTIATRGSPVFAHRRVGKGGVAFNCYKFRSMCRDADVRLEKLLRDDPALRREWMLRHKLENDPRITRFGHFLRRTSLDELPQLFNVLIGDMSLVGPRPVVHDELGFYGRHLPSYLAMKPGLTGLWQVTCRSESTYRRRVAIDRVYALHKCLLLDLRILAATVPAVLSRKGAL
jgi:lipopolysaccharide/colanic/teichoic acid biosynthesis glycosyltransferase